MNPFLWKIRLKLCHCGEISEKPEIFLMGPGYFGILRGAVERTFSPEMPSLMFNFDAVNDRVG